MPEGSDHSPLPLTTWLTEFPLLVLVLITEAREGTAEGLRPPSCTLVNAENAWTDDSKPEDSDQFTAGGLRPPPPTSALNPPISSTTRSVLVLESLCVQVVEV